jgi:uncharacterized protein (TIGR03083 family)
MKHLVPREQAFDLFQRSGRQVEAILDHLIAGGHVPATPIPHMDWTVGDLAVHLAQGAEIAGRLLQGEASPYTEFQRISELNAELLAGENERDLARSRRRFAEGFREMNDRFKAMADDMRVPFHAGHLFTPAQAMVMISIEWGMHSWDLAQATGDSIDVATGDALLMIYTIADVMPNAVDREAAAGFIGTFELRLRGGACLRLHFEDGDLSISDVEPGGPADCRISAEPVAFLFMGNGRGSRVAPLLTGKVVAWGRKPWLAGMFNKLIQTP